MIDALLGEFRPDDWRLYMPVLRAKASEWDALSKLTPGVRHRIAPIIEFVTDWSVPEATTSTRKRRAPQTHAKYFARFLDSLIKATPAGAIAFAYLGHAGPEARWNGIDLWDEFASSIPNESRAIPLVDLGSVGGAASIARVTAARREVGLRVDRDDLRSLLDGRIAAALERLGVTAAATHIVVDLKDQPTNVSHDQVRSALGNVDAFATVTVLAGVFPRDLRNYQPGVTPEPRREWQAWWREHTATTTGKRIISYGDYTTQWAHYQPSPEVAGSVSLRYTTDDSVLVFRGRQSNSATGFGHEQMHGHCLLLVRRPDYDGASFSWGDHRFHCWTSPANGTGNAQQWRTAALVHHITHVVTQLHDPAGASSTAREWARAQTPPHCGR